MNYTIGEFASILGVTTDTLRLYEKHEIIKPRKDNKNNYRYFHDLDARNLLMSRWYRSMQIPLQEAATLIKDASLEDIKKRIEETQVKLEEEIKKSTLLLNKIVQINNNCKEIENSFYKCKRKNMPGIYRLKQTNRDQLLKDDVLREMVTTWMELLPYTFYSFRIKHDALLSEEHGFEYDWGLAINEDEIHHFNLEINEHVDYIAPRVYVSSVIACSPHDYINRDSLQFMMDHLKENHHSITGDIMGKLILTERTEGKNRSYLEVNIPV